MAVVASSNSLVDQGAVSRLDATGVLLHHYQRPETIDETAALINEAGGQAVALRVDHTVESEVKALFRRITRAHRRIDIVVNSNAGEDPLMRQYGFLWQADLKNADAIFRQALTSHIITAKRAALAMMPQKRGLIVEVTENDMLGGGGNPMSQVVKGALKTLSLSWAAELQPHDLAASAVTPGFLRSESMLQAKGVSEDNWRDAGRKDPNFLVSESPLFGRARRCRPRRRSERDESDGDVVQFLGACPRLRLHRLRWAATRLGPPRHRFLDVPSIVHRLRPDGCRSADELADHAANAREAVPREDSSVEREAVERRIVASPQEW